jgi:GTP cyclohydrolase FolE2
MMSRSSERLKEAIEETFGVNINVEHLEELNSELNELARKSNANVDDTISWLLTPNPHLNNRRPLDLFDNDESYQELKDYMESVNWNIFS